MEFGLPIVESYLNRLSSWNQGLMLKFIEKVKFKDRGYICFFNYLLSQVFYSRSMYQINSIKTINKGGQYHSGNYKQGFQFEQVYEFLLDNLNAKLKENPLLTLLDSLLDSFQAGIGMNAVMTLHPSSFNLSEQAQKYFGKRFEPEMMKYFNLCGSIFENQGKWWRSGLLQKELDDSIIQISDQQIHSCAN